MYGRFEKPKELNGFKIQDVGYGTRFLCAPGPGHVTEWEMSEFEDMFRMRLFDSKVHVKIVVALIGCAVRKSPSETLGLFEQGFEQGKPILTYSFTETKSKVVSVTFILESNTFSFFIYRLPHATARLYETDELRLYQLCDEGNSKPEHSDLIANRWIASDIENQMKKRQEDPEVWE